MKRIILWLIFAIPYGLFFIWYTNFEGPLTEAEISTILKDAQSRGRSPEILNTIEHFMRTDDGRDFIMINLLDLNENPPVLPATGPDADASDLLNHYTEHVYLEQFKRASHPIFFGEAVADAIDLVGIDGASHWEFGALFRYRSRRDMMEMVNNPLFADRHEYKIAALTKTIAYPVRPDFNPGDIRLLIGLLLFTLASLLDMLFFRRGIHH